MLSCRKKIKSTCVLSVIIFFSCTNRDSDIKIIRTYYPSGSIKTEQTLSNGSKNGITKVYYENGVLKKQYFYKNDTLQGACTFYNDKGEIETKGFFFHNIPCGPSFYYSNNKLVTYNERDFQGVYYAKKYDSSGNIIKEEGYAISPNVFTTSSIDTFRINSRITIIFFYSEPPGYKNFLQAFSNNADIKFEKLEPHICMIDTTVQTKGKYEFRMIGTLYRNNEKLFTDTSLKIINVE